tara:strand:- start:1618 stop:2112 length:495 start_codon:yes stop_codon:yes gene_type:complete
MRLEVLRVSSGADSTNGLLFLLEDHCNETDGLWTERTFLCYTLEDEYRDKKIFGETRIPKGNYKLGFRKTGGYTQRYAKKFPEIHKGMLHVLDVPGFEYILIHCGNTDEHTAGCLLVGDSQENNQIKKDGFIGRSTQAYTRIYPKIAQAIEDGKDVTITYKDMA